MPTLCANSSYMILLRGYGGYNPGRCLAMICEFRYQIVFYSSCFIAMICEFRYQIVFYSSCFNSKNKSTRFVNVKYEASSAYFCRLRPKSNCKAKVPVLPLLPRYLLIKLFYWSWGYLMFSGKRDQDH